MVTVKLRREDLKRAARLYAGPREAAQALGCSLQGLRRALKREGITPRWAK